MRATVLYAYEAGRPDEISLQPGDVPDTYADMKDLVDNFDYKPTTSVQQGVENFVKWFKDYNNL